MLLISWVLIGWYWCMLTLNTLVSILSTLFLRRVPLTYWSKTFHISGFPHTIVTDNAPCSTSEEFKGFCKERGIIHLTGAPYHPSTNGAAERLVQTFKQVRRKSAQLPKKALLDFLRQYRRTPTDSRFSPSQLLNGRQIRTKLHAILPSPAHIMQGKQTRAISSNDDSRHSIHNFKTGDPLLRTLLWSQRSEMGSSRGRQTHWHSYYSSSDSSPR